MRGSWLLKPIYPGPGTSNSIRGQPGSPNLPEHVFHHLKHVDDFLVNPKRRMAKHKRSPDIFTGADVTNVTFIALSDA